MSKAMVSPNRMELMKRRKALAVARRGHKMLKDKRDELMRNFLILIKENQRLRILTDDRLAGISDSMAIISSEMPSKEVLSSLMVSSSELKTEVSYKHIMGVEVPEFNIPDIQAIEHGKIPSYGLARTTLELDDSIQRLNSAVPDMLKLAGIEKTVQLLADEIEKTRRRVNSLEYVVIPNLESEIKDIKMKMEENDRGNLTRLMKVKDMIIKRDRAKRHSS